MAANLIFPNDNLKQYLMNKPPRFTSLEETSTLSTVAADGSSIFSIGTQWAE
jgi:hypothetical protein